MKRPSTKLEYYDDLCLTSIRMQRPQAIQPVFDTSYPIPIDRVKETNRNQKRRLKILQEKYGGDLSGATFNKNTVVDCYQSHLDQANLIHNKRELEPVPGHYHDLIEQMIRDFNPHYKQAKLSGTPQYFYYSKSTQPHGILVNIGSYGCNYCMNIRDNHTSNRVYFVLTEKGITQKCHNTMICKEYKGTTKSIPFEYKNALFGTIEEDENSEYSVTSLLRNTNKLRREYPFLFKWITDEEITDTINTMKTCVKLRNISMKWVATRKKINIWTLQEQMICDHEFACDVARKFGKTAKIRNFARQNLRKIRAYKLRKYGPIIYTPSGYSTKILQEYKKVMLATLD